MRVKLGARTIGRTLKSGKCQKGYRKSRLGGRNMCILSGSLGKAGKGKRRKSTMGRRRRK